MNADQPPPRQWRATGPLVIGAIALLVLVGVLGGWSVQARISGAIIAAGVIKVESNRQVIQHPHGGVVSALLVKDGDHVAAGDIVLALEGTQLRSQLAVIEGHLFELLARKARLQAERDGAQVMHITGALRDLVQQVPAVQTLIDGQNRLFQARAMSLGQNSAQIGEQIKQSENQISGAAHQLDALQIQHHLIAGELADSQTLFAKGLTPASRVSALRREQARLAGEIGRITADIAQMRGQIATLNIARLSLSTRLREEAISALRDLQLQETDFVQRRLGILDRLAGLHLRAPVSGVVYGSRVFSLQSVISPAEPVMYIIPQDQPLVISARIDPVHVDQVHIGQAATLRFAAFDQRKTPQTRGKVTRISADVLTDEVSGKPYYHVELIPLDADLAKLDGQILLPGMPVDAFLKTQDRSPLNYLAQPVTDYFARAFREG
jgi:HlyD family secretion protein